MARIDERLPGNAAGDLYVDSSCIDCETCRELAPAVFGRDDALGMSVVRAQPEAPAEERRALMALVACPTASIGDARKRSLAQAARAFPEEIADGVYYCGYAAESSYGASSYLIRRPDGNVLVDSPRAARPLVERIRALGGVRLMFLSHRDDVADHEKWHRAFGCERILHAADVGRDTAAVERPLQGTDPVRLAGDLLAIPVPGHTRGSTALLYADRFLFSGDHLWGDEDGIDMGTLGGSPNLPATGSDGHSPSSPTRRLAMGRSVCWYSWSEQVRSLRRLLDFRFQWVLPGHGRRFQARSADDMRAAIETLLA